MNRILSAGKGLILTFLVAISLHITLRMVVVLEVPSSQVRFDISLGVRYNLTVSGILAMTKIRKDAGLYPNL